MSAGDRPTCNASARCENYAQPSCRGMCKKHYRAWLDAHPPIDGRIVHRHIEKLRANGLGYRRISELSGVAMSTVRDLAVGKRRYTQGPVGAAILALPIESRPAKLNPAGATRRIRALIAEGFTETRIGDEIGVGQHNLWKYVQGSASWVRPETFDRIVATYERLLAEPRPEGWIAERARNRARARGWLTAERWEWGEIDDPDFDPALLLPDKPDWQFRIPADFGERYLDMRDHVGLDNATIAKHFGIQYDTLTKRLRQLGIRYSDAQRVVQDDDVEQAS